MRTFNDQILNAGLKYSPDGKHYVEIQGTCWVLRVPISSLGRLAHIFPEIEWEQGKFIHDIIGSYVRVTITGSGRVYALHHITRCIDYINYKEG